MAFSKDPEQYTDTERQILILATENVITIPCEDERTAIHIRHRLYALRRATLDIADKIRIFEAAGKPTDYLKTPFVRMAPALIKVSIQLMPDKTTLEVGGVAVSNVDQILLSAIKAAGHTTVVEKSQTRMKEAEKGFTKPIDLEPTVEAEPSIDKASTIIQQRYKLLDKTIKPPPDDDETA